LTNLTGYGKKFIQVLIKKLCRVKDFQSNTGPDQAVMYVGRFLLSLFVLIFFVYWSGKPGSPL